MKIVIVLLFIANAEKPTVMDVYDPTAGAYKECKQKAKQLNATKIWYPNGHWDCSIRDGKDL